jgi:hypothetical protein
LTKKLFAQKINLQIQFSCEWELTNGAEKP